MKGCPWGYSMFCHGPDRGTGTQEDKDGPAWARVPSTHGTQPGWAITHVLWSLPALRAVTISGVPLSSLPSHCLTLYVLCLTMSFSFFGNLCPICHQGGGKIQSEITMKLDNHPCKAAALPP